MSGAGEQGAGGTPKGEAGQVAIDWQGMHARVAAAMAGLARGFEPGAAEVDRRLRERAARLARGDEAAGDVQGDMRLLEFALGDRVLAVDSRWVREVCADLMPAPVPNVPAWVAGVIYLRGEVLTVVDFDRLSGAGTADRDEASHIIVLHQGNRALGLLAGPIHGLNALSRGDMGNVPATVQGTRRYYQGVAPGGALVLDSAGFFEEDGLPGLGGRDRGAEG
ncbi:chemotaxis protein CheW [Niveispirillum fermenti]|uniref:chemotaxis protein CheW n=1 Tax=Niveispirillum fermenti TaxID=1233113 RepID=UPI003A8A01A8